MPVDPRPAPPDPLLAEAARLSQAGQAAAALALLDRLLAEAPDDHAALSLHAVTLVRARRLDDADAAFVALTRHHPGDAAGWLNHGHLLKTAGRVAAALAAYRRAIAIAPGLGVAWWAIANLQPADLTAGDVAAMRTQLATAATDGDRLHLHLALGKALDGLGEHAAAFAHLQAGNAIRAAAAPFDADLFAATLRRAEAAFTPALLAARADTGAAARDPIFILGMPRSGSTLVEQILASHPLVEGTEELHALNRIARTLPDGPAALPPARLAALGDLYLQAARPYRRTDRPFFTDKMPSNWLHAGLIRLIMPRARIVDVRRHPMASGFANFTQHYAQGNDFAYDLRAIGRFYADYVRHMAHVDRVAPGMIHRVHHEALVADLEGEVRRLLAFLDLPFDAACLRFHATDRPVHTPSTAQVRRPVNRDGLDRWRPYAAWLAPLAEALGPVLDAYPDVPADG